MILFVFHLADDGEEDFEHESTLYDDEPKGRGKERKRGTFPKHATNILKSWLFQHLSVRAIIHQT